MSFATRAAALEEIDRLTRLLDQTMGFVSDRLTDASLVFESHDIAGGILERSSQTPALKLLFEGSELDLSTATLDRLNGFIGALTASVQGADAVLDTLDDPSVGGQRIVDVATGSLDVLGQWPSTVSVLPGQPMSIEQETGQFRALASCGSTRPSASTTSPRAACRCSGSSSTRPATSSASRSRT